MYSGGGTISCDCYDIPLTDCNNVTKSTCCLAKCLSMNDWRHKQGFSAHRVAYIAHHECTGGCMPACLFQFAMDGCVMPSVMYVMLIAHTLRNISRTYIKPIDTESSEARVFSVQLFTTCDSVNMPC